MTKFQFTLNSLHRFVDRAEHFAFLIAQENFQLPRAIGQGICHSLMQRDIKYSSYNRVCILKSSSNEQNLPLFFKKGKWWD